MGFNRTVNYDKKSKNEFLQYFEASNTFLYCIFTPLCFLRQINCIILEIFLLGNNIYCLNIKFIEYNGFEDYSPVSHSKSYYLCPKTSSFIRIDDSLYFQEPLETSNREKYIAISYPNDINISFKFLDEIILENKEEVSIYMKENELHMLALFIKILQECNDTITQTDSKIFFEILKYLNIFRVERNRNYKAFIRTLVYYYVISNSDFVKNSYVLILNQNEYGNLHVRDVIECFLQFILMQKAYIYDIFHKYNPIIFSHILSQHKKYKTSEKIVCIEMRACCLNKCILSRNNINIWKILMKIFLIDKLYINFCSYENDLDSDIIIALLPKIFINLKIVIDPSKLPLFGKLHQIGCFKSVKKVKISSCDIKLQSFLEKLQYFETVEKLALEFLEDNLQKSIIILEKLTILKSVKVMKLFFSISSPHLYNAFSSLLGTKDNIIIDLSNELKISDDEDDFGIFSSYNCRNYLRGIDLILYKDSYDSTYFSKIFNFELIRRLKIDLRNVKNNSLNSYRFLESFKSLKRLYFKNIKFTDELYTAILASTSLIFYQFKVFDIKKDNIGWNFYNKSVIHIEFQNLELLKCYKYQTDCKNKNLTSFSILNVVSYFFNLENLEKLNYDVGTLYTEDIVVFSRFKLLKYLSLSVQKTDLNLKILNKILQQNIKNTIIKLHIRADKLEKFEIFSILNFKQLKILKMGIILDTEINKQRLERLIG
ncbi:hypothetical protein CWI38_0283p0030 [Hamiltosporidium tvaerminnensis]|uniref:Uncharacterized protein n=1 Tax=Hamiltosporidium tvaerminnensis TaxID=1176355 RepID=A0A4Q9M1N9_9MICR|nr:hypothetical protein CWI38_0283p0030 [Hamiltosporidium tvaerminnensis]